MRAKRSTETSPQLARGIRRSCVGLIAMSIAAVPVVANAATSQADPCHRTSDEKSVYMRSLQTDLMVAALTCNSGDQYNDFIHRFQTVLKTDAAHLQGFYKKKHGKAGAEELNTFVTRLANDESERSIQQGQSAYCDNSGKLFTAVLALSPKEIEDYSTTLPISSEAPVRQCMAAPVAEKAKPAAAATTSTDTSAAPAAASTDSVTVETK